MILVRPKGGLLKIGDDALSTMNEYRQRASEATEAGGILLGRLLSDGGNVVIDRATPPAPEDRRSRFTFWRAWWPAQRRVNAAWDASNGTEQYLGEWHSHPEPDPRPSPKDFKEWRKVLARTRQAPPELFFVIVGQRATRVWEGAVRSSELRELERRTQQGDSAANAATAE